MPIAIEREEIIKEYVFTHAQILNVLGAGPTEVLIGASLDNGILCVTQKPNPTTQRTYRISYPEARALMGLVNTELFTVLDFADEVTIHTSRQTT